MCYVFNSNSGNLAISNEEVIKEPSGLSASLITKNCPSVMGAGGICRSVFGVSARDVVACKVTVSPKSNGRASIEIRDSSNNAINSKDLR